MRVGVLGPLEDDAEDGPVALAGRTSACCTGAAKTLQSHVVRLRRALKPDRPRSAAGQILVTPEPGYLLRVPPAALDAARFEVS